MNTINTCNFSESVTRQPGCRLADIGIENAVFNRLKLDQI